MGYKLIKPTRMVSYMEAVILIDGREYTAFQGRCLLNSKILQL